VANIAELSTAVKTIVCWPMTKQLKNKLKLKLSVDEVIKSEAEVIKLFSSSITVEQNKLECL
jgi:hypothetical protein